jgi:hypothetical protein
MKRIALNIVAFFAVLSLSSCGYNSMVKLDEQVTSQWAQVENVYQRRVDLIPNLVSSVNDYILISIQLNPTLSAALTYGSAGAGSYAEYAVGNGTITVTGAGTVLWSNYYVVNTQTPPSILELDYLSNIGMTLGNVSDQLVICGTPVTATVVNYTSMNFKEY